MLKPNISTWFFILFFCILAFMICRLDNRNIDMEVVLGLLVLVNHWFHQAVGMKINIITVMWNTLQMTNNSHPDICSLMIKLMFVFEFTGYGNICPKPILTNCLILALAHTYFITIKTQFLLYSVTGSQYNLSIWKLETHWFPPEATSGLYTFSSARNTWWARVSAWVTWVSWLLWLSHGCTGRWSVWAVLYKDQGTQLLFYCPEQAGVHI